MHNNNKTINKYLVGTFSTSQQVIFGKKKTNGIIYKVYVYNNDQQYYLVSYNGKLKGKLIIIFKPINDKEGTIIDVIGLMNEDNLIKTLQYIYNIFKKNQRLILIINPLENNINRILINKNIFSIDPHNCNDIDDAISYEKNEYYYIIGIYIAQPIYYLSLDIIENYSKITFSTLYNEPYTKNNNLWGNEITSLSSLYPNILRPVYAIFYYYNMNLELVKIEHFPAKIINKIQTNYDECLQFCNDLYILTNKLNQINDTHEMVSYWMIKTNNYIGNIFSNLNLPKRVIKKSLIEVINVDNDIKNVFLNKLSNSAYYSLDDNYHEILDKFDYIHMTSPIRRIIDTINHWCITYNINYTDLNINLDDINRLDKLTKKYHNNIKLLSLIDKLENEQELYGWIYKNNWNKCIEKKKSIKLTVYFKELGFQRVELWNYKFINIINKNDINKINNLKIGYKYLFKIYKIEGFLPYHKIKIILSENNII